MKFLRALLLLVMLAVSAAGHAQSLPVHDLAVLVDPDGVENIATVSAAMTEKSFHSVPGSFSAGYTRDVHWLRFTVQVPTSDEWWLEVEPPFLDDLRLFEPGPAGFIEHRAGDRLPFTSRQQDYRGFIFKLKLDTAPRTFYLRLKTSSTSMAALQLWRADRFPGAKNTEYGILGFNLGFVTLMLLLNLLLWVTLRDSLFGWFALHTFSSLLMSLASSGLLAQYLLRDSPRLADDCVGAALFFLVACTAPFFRRMVGVDRERQPWLFRVFRVQTTLPLAMLLALLTDYYLEAARMIVMLWLPLTLLMLILSFRVWRQGRAEGIYMLVANVISLAGSMTSALAVLGITAGDLYTLNIRQFTLLGHTLAMQFALGVRIRVMHAERHEAMDRVREAELDAAREREAHTEQGRFIAMLSHELKTPLAVIDSAAQALARIDRSNNPEVGRRHERIRRGVSRIDRLVEQFLTTDRVDVEGITVRSGPVNMAKLLSMVADTSPDGAERLHLAVPDELLLVADAALLRVAVSNLVDNALKYAPPDSPIHLSALPQQDSGMPGVEIMVSDEGPGIPPALQAQIFSRYTRGENVGHVSGAGLGLYLVRRIAELHGGHVDLLPDAPGAVFRLWLPSKMGAVACP